jgi:transposase-like protein
MHDEPTGVPAALQSPKRKRCQSCQQVKHRTNFSTTPASRSSCQDCQRASSRLAGQRRRAAVRLLIAFHPKEYQALLGLVRGRRQLGTPRPKGGGRDAA